VSLAGGEVSALIRVPAGIRRRAPGRARGRGPVVVSDGRAPGEAFLTRRRRRGATEASGALLCRYRHCAPAAAIPAAEALQRLEAEGKTAVLVAEAGVVVGVVAVADTVRPEARAAVGALRGMHIDVWMITGDNRRTA